MGEDDFVLVAEDDDRVAEIADAAIEAIRAMPAPAPAPVAVSERRPEAKDCLFNEGATIGKCWCFNPQLGGVPWWSFEPLEWAEDATHWLPCNAIPLPQVGEVEA
jgi:hypothetical protein